MADGVKEKDGFNFLAYRDNSNNTSVTLPSEFTELHIVMNQGSGQAVFTWNILKGDLNDSIQTFTNGFYMATDNNRGVAVSVSKSIVSKLISYVNGTDDTSWKMAVYYK